VGVKRQVRIQHVQGHRQVLPRLGEPLADDAGLGNLGQQYPRVKDLTMGGRLDLDRGAGGDGVADHLPEQVVHGAGATRRPRRGAVPRKDHLLADPEEPDRLLAGPGVGTELDVDGKVTECLRPSRPGGLGERVAAGRPGRQLGQAGGGPRPRVLPRVWRLRGGVSRSGR
jgi:hypothetical protein